MRSFGSDTDVFFAISTKSISWQLTIGDELSPRPSVGITAIWTPTKVIASQAMSISVNQRMTLDLMQSLTPEQQSSVVRFTQALADRNRLNQPSSIEAAVERPNQAKLMTPVNLRGRYPQIGPKLARRGRPEGISSGQPDERSKCQQTPSTGTTKATKKGPAAKPSRRGQGVPCIQCGVRLTEEQFVEHWEKAHKTLKCPICHQMIALLELPDHIGRHVGPSGECRPQGWAFLSGGLCSPK